MPDIMGLHNYTGEVHCPRGLGTTERHRETGYVDLFWPPAHLAYLTNGHRSISCVAVDVIASMTNGPIRSILKEHPGV